MAMLPVFLPVSKETANGDEFADVCLHRQFLGFHADPFRAALSGNSKPSQRG